MQSNRAAEQAVAEQSAGHVACALLSRDSLPGAGQLGVITRGTEKWSQVV